MSLSSTSLSSTLKGHSFLLIVVDRHVAHYAQVISQMDTIVIH